MTRERNCIQENVNSYIVKNCPSCTKQDDCIAMYLRTSVECKNRTNCVIKRVIEKCKDMASDRDYCAYDFANDILQQFEIEEVRE